MSAALLHDNSKCNKLEDDRESCLHVLTWTALRFTDHTISGGGTSRFLRAFDEQYQDEDGVRGGDLKKGFLLGRDIPRVIKFDRCPHLDALVRELTEVFAARYEEPPSAEQISQLQRLRDKGLTDDELGNDVVLNYEERMASLKSPSWLVDTFRHHLDSEPKYFIKALWCQTVRKQLIHNPMSLVSTIHLSCLILYKWLLFIWFIHYTSSIDYYF